MRRRTVVAGAAPPVDVYLDERLGKVAVEGDSEAESEGDSDDE